MPTQRFFNLKEEKRKVILDAAVHEFTRVPFSEVSINKIIKEADISRGSFYTYFEDKKDLARYILRGFREKFREAVFEAMDSAEGNFFEVPLLLLRRLMAEGTSGMGYKMYQNMLSDLNVINQSQIFGVQSFHFQDPSYEDFIRELYRRLDKERCPMDEETLAYAAEISILLSMKGIALYYKEEADQEMILKTATRELRIVERGACAMAAQSEGQMQKTVISAEKGEI